MPDALTTTTGSSGITGRPAPISGKETSPDAGRHNRRIGMDLGRARYRQAHRLPPRRWDAGALVIAIIVTLAVVVTWVPEVVK